jgi:pimeloyl-ACP methyl ester carboxylesterase
MSDARSMMITVPGGQMHGLDFGPADRPIDMLFLHATGFNAHTYAPLLAPLATKRRILALDMRGHGQSALPAVPSALTSWDIFARDTVAALSAIKAKKLIVAGHSMGAAVAVLAAIRQPMLAKQLVLFDPAAPGPLWSAAAQLPLMPLLMRRFVPIARAAGRRRASFESLDAMRAAYAGRGAFKGWDDAFLDGYLAGGARVDADGRAHLRCAPAYEQATFAALRHNLWGALKQLPCPADLYVAAHGSTAAHGLAYLGRAAPKVHVHKPEGTGHLFPMQQPEIARAALATALKSIRG